MSADERIIGQAVTAYRNGEAITDLQARVVANAWHSGQSSALYSLTSTGAITAATVDELTTEPQDSDELAALLDYVTSNGPRGPVPGWSDLSW